MNRNRPTPEEMASAALTMLDNADMGTLVDSLVAPLLREGYTPKGMTKAEAVNMVYYIRVLATEERGHIVGGE